MRITTFISLLFIFSTYFLVTAFTRTEFFQNLVSKNLQERKQQLEQKRLEDGKEILKVFDKMYPVDMERLNKESIQKNTIKQLLSATNLRNIPEGNNVNPQSYAVFEIGTDELNPKFTKWSETVDLSWDGSGTLVAYPFFSEIETKNSILLPEMVEKIVNPSGMGMVDSFHNKPYRSKIVLYSKSEIKNTYLQENGKVISKEGTVTVNGKVISNLYVYTVQ